MFPVFVIVQTHMHTNVFIITAPPQSGAASGICGAGVGLVVWAVTVLFAARFVDTQGKCVSITFKS